MLSSREADLTSLSLEELQRERLDILIKINVGSRRRRLLRLKKRTKFELDTQDWTCDQEWDDLTLCLMETCIQLPSTRLTDALRQESQDIFTHIDDWKEFEKMLDDIDDVRAVRRCIEKWIRHAVRADRRRDSTCPKTLLWQFPSNFRRIGDIIEWLDDRCDVKFL